MTSQIASLVEYDVGTTIEAAMYVIKYTKANVADTLDISTLVGLTPYSSIKSIKFAKAVIDASGADDPITWSGTTITFSSGTGAGRCFIVGTGQ